MLFFCKPLGSMSQKSSWHDQEELSSPARSSFQWHSSSLVAFLQMSSPQSHWAVSERSISFYRACVNSETHRVISEIVPAQFCLKIRNTLQEWTEEWKRIELHLCPLPVVGEETANPNTPAWKKCDGWHHLSGPWVVSATYIGNTALNNLMPQYLPNSFRHRNITKIAIA